MTRAGACTAARALLLVLASVEPRFLFVFHEKNIVVAKTIAWLLQVKGFLKGTAFTCICVLCASLCDIPLCIQRGSWWVGISAEVIKAPRGVLIYSWYVGSGTQTKGRHFCSLFSGRLVMVHVWSIISPSFFCYPHINASLILIGPRVAVDYSVDCMRASSLPPLCHVAVQHHTHAAPTPASAASAHSWAQAAS